MVLPLTFFSLYHFFLWFILWLFSLCQISLIFPWSICFWFRFSWNCFKLFGKFKSGLGFGVTKCNMLWAKFKLFFTLFSVNQGSKLFLRKQSPSKSEKRFKLQISGTIRQNTTNFWISSAPHKKKLEPKLYLQETIKEIRVGFQLQENGYLLTMNFLTSTSSHLLNLVLLDLFVEQSSFFFSCNIEEENKVLFFSSTKIAVLSSKTELLMLTVTPASLFSACVVFL